LSILNKWTNPQAITAFISGRIFRSLLWVTYIPVEKFSYSLDELYRVGFIRLAMQGIFDLPELAARPVFI
jgi:hypothetical protein